MSDLRVREDLYQPQLVASRPERFVVLSGCSGAGKSSLLAELERRGFQVFEEAGRQIVKEQIYIDGPALPWRDFRQFLEISICRSMHCMIKAAKSGRISFFDRGIIDQISGFERANLSVPGHLTNAARKYRYYEKVFVLPPWKEIFRNDEERRHSFADAEAAYDSLVAAYERFGYQPVLVPKTDIAARVDFILAHTPGSQVRDSS
ncbi:MAG TPA: AAA family ATPase [Candidatus Aquilonibacter sp.]|nr:AAA family ATPase [Candidatus Aquilonibacter sp.]